MGEAKRRRQIAATSGVVFEPKRPGGTFVRGPEAAAEMKRLLDLPVTILSNWPVEQRGALDAVCRQLAADGMDPTIHQDVGGQPVVLGTKRSGRGLGLVAIDDVTDRRRVRIFGGNG